MLFCAVVSGVITVVSPNQTQNCSIICGDQVAVGWLFDGHRFTPPKTITQPNSQLVSPTTLTAAQQAQALMSNGLIVNSTSGNWKDTFSVTADNYGTPIALLLLAEQKSLDNTNNLQFIGGHSTINWPSVSGTLYSLTPTQFNQFELGIGQFVAVCRDVANGVPNVTLPFNTLTIS